MNDIDEVISNTSIEHVTIGVNAVAEIVMMCDYIRRIYSDCTIKPLGIFGVEVVVEDTTMHLSLGSHVEVAR